MLVLDIRNWISTGNNGYFLGITFSNRTTMA